MRFRLARVRLGGIVLRDLFDQHPHMSRQPVGLACQVDTQPIAYFLANSCTGNAVDLNIIANGSIGHDIFLVGLSAVKTPGFQRDNCNRTSIVPLLFFFSSCSCEGTLLQRKRRCSSHRA
jgi:hypothetical protein